MDTVQQRFSPTGVSLKKASVYPFAAKVALALVSVGIAAGLGEAALRFWFCDELILWEDERSLMYRYDASLGWFPIPGSQCVFKASRPISVVNNSRGFRAPEPIPSEKPVIAFIGDSFVWGYDVEAAERFTDKLQAKHPEWNVCNLGVSGYGTDQELLLLQQVFDTYKPRVVFLMFCVETDNFDNSLNSRYNGFYKPYFTVVGDELQLCGVPVPRSARVFFAEHRQLTRSYLIRLFVRAYFKVTTPPELRNPDPTEAILRRLKAYVESKGALLLLGSTTNIRSQPHEAFLEECHIPHIDVTTPLRYPRNGIHWTPDGHSFVCDKIDEFLLRGKYMERRPPPP